MPTASAAAASNKQQTTWPLHWGRPLHTHTHTLPTLPALPLSLCPTLQQSHSPSSTRSTGTPYTQRHTCNTISIATGIQAAAQAATSSELTHAMATACASAPAAHAQRAVQHGGQSCPPLAASARRPHTAGWRTVCCLQRPWRRKVPPHHTAAGGNSAQLLAAPPLPYACAAGDRTRTLLAAGKPRPSFTLQTGERHRHWQKAQHSFQPIQHAPSAMQHAASAAHLASAASAAASAVPQLPAPALNLHCSARKRHSDSQPAHSKGQGTAS